MGWAIPTSMDAFDRLWARLVRVVAFFGGLAIMFYETAFDKSDRPWLYAAAVGMMGLPVARAAENVLGRIGGGGPQVTPSQQPVDQPTAGIPKQAPPEPPPRTGQG